MSSESNTLYRKYRPRRFGDVLGQDHAVKVLTEAIKQDRVAHAYLFAGPRGTGKTTLARILAKRLNCLNPSNEGPDACGVCAQCIASSQDANLDLIEIDAASNRGIDDIRDLKDRVRIAPAGGTRKVYIIDEVHMLSTPAFNALLKTLEEPPEHVVFMLATTELHKIPETVRSRCQAFHFRRASIELIVQRLTSIAAAERVNIHEDALALIAYQSEGCFRDAESLLGQALANPSIENNAHEGGAISAQDIQEHLGIVGFSIVQSFTDALLKKDAKRALHILHDISNKGLSVRNFSDTLTRYLRAAASYAAAGVHTEQLPEDIEHILVQHAQTNSGDLVPLLRAFLVSKTEMRDAMHEEFPIEIAILEWCGEYNASTPPQQKEHVVARQPAHIEPKNEQKPPQGSSDRPVDTPSTPEADQALLTNIHSHWEQFMQKSAELNPLLISTLQATTPIVARGNVVYFVTDVQLFRDRMNDDSIRKPLENVLLGLIGQPVRFQALLPDEAKQRNFPERNMVVSKQNKTKSSEQLDPVREALSIIGGELMGEGA